MSCAALIIGSQSDGFKKFCEKIDRTGGDRVLPGTMITDLAVIILSLVFAILGLTKVIPMPPVGSYTLFATAGLFLLLDIGTMAICKCLENKKKQP